MPFQIVRNDITKVKADAIVNTANPKPVIGGSTDSAIYKAAGEKLLLKERKAIGDMLCQFPEHGSRAFLRQHCLPAYRNGSLWLSEGRGVADCISRDCILTQQ